MTTLSSRSNIAVPVNNTNAEIGLLAMFDVLNEIAEKAELDIGSASTCNIGAMASTKLRITGTTTITSFGTVYRGPVLLRAASGFTITYNATTMVCPGNVNLVAAAGDVLMVWPKTTASGTSNGWQIVRLARGTNVLPIAEGGTGADTAVAAFDAIKQAASESATGVTQLAPVSAALAGAAGNKVVTTAGLSWPRAFSTNGYQKLPGTPGLLLQWGISANLGDIPGGSRSTTLTFPIAFPAGVLCVIPAMAVSNSAHSGITAQWDQALTTLTTAAIKYAEYAAVTQVNAYIIYFAVGY